MRKISPTIVIFCIIMLCTTFILTAIAEDDRAEVSLTVAVIVPEYETYVGRGFLYIEDQRGHGKAKLLIPNDEDYSVRLEIFKGDGVIASWEWSILKHEIKTRKYRKHEYITDKYVCEDGDGRRLRISIYTHRWHDHERISVMATGRRVFFIAHM